jgi:hypothetical protein
MNTRVIETDSNIVKFPTSLKKPVESAVYDSEADVAGGLEYYLDKSLDAVSEAIVSQVIESRPEMSALEAFMNAKEKTRTLKLNLQRLKYYLDEMESIEIP